MKEALNKTSSAGSPQPHDAGPSLFLEQEYPPLHWWRENSANEPPPKGVRPKRSPGAFAGMLNVDDSFFDALSEDDVALWEGER